MSFHPTNRQFVKSKVFDLKRNEKKSHPNLPTSCNRTEKNRKIINTSWFACYHFFSFLTKPCNHIALDLFCHVYVFWTKKVELLRWPNCIRTLIDCNHTHKRWLLDNGHFIKIGGGERERERLLYLLFMWSIKGFFGQVLSLSLPIEFLLVQVAAFSLL